ncbi:MAG: PDZ domain-containing protein [Acidimicrobiales bacterium]|nr:PDZ domain-containing protein [Acidimicrobiales bacterium]
MDTRDDTVLPAPQAAPGTDDPVRPGESGEIGGAGDGSDAVTGGRPRYHRLRWALVIVAALLFVAFVASMFIRLPYYLIAPGSVRATEPLVSVEGGPEHPPEEGAIFFTTVSTRPARALTAFLGWLDPDTDVVDEEVVLGDHSAEENRQVNLQMMDNSVDVAAEVAFEHLGFDVESGTGAVILGVAPDLPVAEIARPGDVIVAVDGHRTDTSDEVVERIQAHEPGDEVRLRLERDPSSIEPVDEGAEGEDEGEEREDEGGDDEGGATASPDEPLPVRTEVVELGAQPDDPDRPLLGVNLGTRDQVLDLPFPVAIDTGQVGGPSAGLAFTLAVLDVLTPGEITGGAQVAVTGTIDGNGNVGPIGGIGQKAAAVREAGADVFLVPASEADQARARAGDVEVIGVETLDDALRALDALGGNALDLEAPEVDQSADG